ncbi:MAG: hypothetical protein MJ009_08035, partial [Paludibacteraceae bacterium]|nr:hypothetical protein [Paludibacteraceae bacterium]
MRKLLPFLILLCISVGASAIDYFYADGASGKTDVYPFSNFQRIEFNRADGLLLDVQLKDKSDILTDNRVVVFATPKYQVQFLNEDGTLLFEGEFDLGSTPVYGGETPTKAETEQYTYSFKGWNPEITTVTGDAVYTAEYTSTLRKYAIKYVNYDGTELQSTEVEYGAAPAYVGETPAKAEDAQYTYTFSGWSPEEALVTGEATYTAQFTSTVKQYTITFVNDDSAETPLYTNDFDYNSVPVYEGPAPVKEATEEYSYTFSHWTPAITKVTADATYKAVYTSTVNNYTIKFVNYDGSELFSKEYEYGSTPVYEGATPTKAADIQYTYTFDGWNPEIGAVTGTQTYTAQFTSTKNQYLITYVNYDGEELQSTEVEYGTTPAYVGETPVKAADAQYTYIFSGWSPEEASVTGEQTYTAQFTSTVKQYTITFVNDD